MKLDQLLVDLPGLRYAQAKDELESSKARDDYLQKYGYLPMKTADVRLELEVLVERTLNFRPMRG